MMLSWLCLVAAVASFGSASLLQASGARASRHTAGAFGLVKDLALSKQYAAGTALDLFAVVLTAIALRDLPLFLVQAATASSLAVTAVGSAVLFPAERGRGVWVPVLAITAGITLLGSAAAEGKGSALGIGAVAVMAAGLPLLLLAKLALDRAGMAPRIRHAALSGLAYAGMGVSLRTLRIPDNALLVVAEPVALTAAGYLALALFFFGRALQRGRVTEVMAIVVSIDTILPASIGVWLLGDRTRPGWDVPALVGLAVTVAGVLWLVRSEPGNPQSPAPSCLATPVAAERLPG
ncbi:MAG: hypothetical protein ABIM89_16090 [Mycobacteriales bacterium]